MLHTILRTMYLPKPTLLVPPSQVPRLLRTNLYPHSYNTQANSDTACKCASKSSHENETQHPPGPIIESSKGSVHKWDSYVIAYLSSIIPICAMQHIICGNDDHGKKNVFKCNMCQKVFSSYDVSKHLKKRHII